MYSVRDSEPEPLSGSVSNYVLIVLALSQTTLFFTVSKTHTIYIYQIEDREILVKNLGSLPYESPLKWQNRGQIWNLSVETSLGMYSVRDSEPEPLSGSVSNYVLIVLALSQTTLFFTVSKTHTIYIYIYQIEDREILVKNLGSLPYESPPFGRKKLKKPRIDSKNL